MNQKGFRKRKSRMDRASWRRWALSPVLKHKRTQVATKLEPCHAFPGCRAEEASSLRRLAL